MKRLVALSLTVLATLASFAVEITRGSGFQTFPSGGKLKAKTSFVITADEKRVVVTVDCVEPNVAKLRASTGENWRGSDSVELFLSPDGTVQNHYHFIIPYRGDERFAAFLAEKGTVEPDPYGPDWTGTSEDTTNGWRATFSIPLSSFYMTRSHQWSKTWLVNVTRNNKIQGELSTWAPMMKSFNEPDHFKKVPGFPKRPNADDVAIESVSADIASHTAAGYAGTLRVTAISDTASEFELSTSFSTETVRQKGVHSIATIMKIPATFPATGRNRTKLTLTRVGTGESYSRYFPVPVAYEPIRMKLTTPEYRDNFYPGQDATRIEGTVESSEKGEIVLTLTGDGIAAQEKKVRGGVFAFDVPDFRKGELKLTASCGGATLAKRIRKVEPTGHVMSWISHGNLVVNGKPVFRRNMYAPSFLCSDAHWKRYRNDPELHMTWDIVSGAKLEPARLIPGIEVREAKRDVMPCRELLAKVEKLIEENREKDFTYWYITDEPEMRGLSQIYLRHLYEFVKERDPNHVMLSVSREPGKYVDCADWFETHPYLDPYTDGEGKRAYQAPMKRMGQFVDKLASQNRPDKCIGFVPTCFSYKFSNANSDYPDFDEYRCHTWAALVAGAKTLFPYYGAGLAERPSLYRGTGCVFASCEALADYFLFGTRTSLGSTDAYRAALWDLKGEKLFAAVNFKNVPQKVTLSGLKGNFREFRGVRTFAADGSLTLELKPFEVAIGTTAALGTNLPVLAAERARWEKEEYERTHRCNQLFQREADVEMTASKEPNRFLGSYALVNGMHEDLCWLDSGTNKWIEFSFPKFTPVFREVRVFGAGTDGMVVKVTKRRQWVTLDPKNVTRSGNGLVYDFGEDIRTVKLRLEFPKPGSVALCEVELPETAASKATDIVTGSGFVVLDKGSKAKGQTAFTISSEPGSVTVRVTATSADAAKFKAWKTGFADTVEVFLSPEGSVQNYYQFVVNSDGTTAVYFFAEKGGIQPDPYDPEWASSVKKTEAGWVCEMTIPLSSFYMTRNSNWNTTWLVNVSRNDKTGGGLSSWSKCLRSFHEPDAFKKVSDCPTRDEKDDVYIEMATMQVERRTDDAYAGKLRVRAMAAQTGDYEVNGVKDYFRPGQFVKVEIPASYPATGRQRTKIVMKRLSDGKAYARYYPVRVDYEPLKVRLTTPEYRDNFYPGQDATRIEGVVETTEKGAIVLTLEGDGIAKREKKAEGEGEQRNFAFSVPEFTKGEMKLTVACGESKVTKRIRKIEPNGHRMTWVSGGNLIVDGKPTFRRDFYAPFWSGSQAWVDVYTNDTANGMFLQRNICRGGWLEPLRLMGGRDFEQKEAKKDIVPCKEYFAKVDKIIESCKNAEFGYYYISDEPDVRGLSEVYLKHIYDYVKERDPYHVILMATRTPAKYVECADWFETHPYLDPHFDATGVRLYQHKMRDFGPYIDQLTALRRGDKCIGFVPTAFTYRFNSSFSDYPTFNEYVCHVMTALAHGAKTLWPFSGGSALGRPGLYEAIRWTFAFTHAYEDLLLFGKRELSHPVAGREKCVWTLGDEKLTIDLNFNAPFDVKYAYEGGRVRALESLAKAQARAAAAESERTDPRNLLVGREKDISITLAGKPGSVFADGHYALFDGGRRTLAWRAPAKDKFVELAFATFTPVFRRIRISGTGLDGATVKVWRKRQWVPLEGIWTRAPYENALTLAEDTKAIKLRIELPSRKATELYEIELLANKPPSVEKAEKKPPAFVRSWGVSNMDERVYFTYDPTNAWFVARLDEAVWEEHPTWQYHAWFLKVYPGIGTLGTGGRQITYATFMAPLPADPKAYDRKGTVQAHVCGMNYTLKFGVFGCVPPPPNRVEVNTFGKTTLKTGDAFEVTFTLADPAEDVTCTLLGNDINGSSAIMLDPVGTDGRVWRKKVTIEKFRCPQKRANETMVQVGALGGTLKGTLVTPIQANFE